MALVHSQWLLVSVLSLCLVVIFPVALIEAQFPTICIENATLPGAICCPTPSDSTFVCGGPHRGSCRRIRVQIDDKKNASRFAALNSSALQDDRVNWPLRFFEYACDCKYNWAGPACDKCAAPWTGPTCGSINRVVRVRKNVLKLSVKDQRLFRDVVNASKYTPSDWSVFSISGRLSADPVTKENLLPYKVTVYDLFVYLHFYATRSTTHDHDLQVCVNAENSLDFSHRGPAFLPWHRYFLHRLEHELIRIAETQFNVTNFALPYWDWTGKNSCEICTNDLMGAFENPNTNSSMDASDNEDIIRFDDETGISDLSPFSKWRPMCASNADPQACHSCDLESRESEEPGNYLLKGTLQRKYSTSAEVRLPTQEEVDRVMSSKEYDSLPYNENAPNTSFRNCLEGYATLGSRNGPLNMHNLVKQYFNGSISDHATSPNDPLFILHHVFLDKLYNLWLRSRNQTDKKFPKNNTAFGHGSYENVIPSFPPEKISRYAVDSKLLGYDYDDSFAGTTFIYPATPKKTALELTPADQPGEVSLSVVVGSALAVCVLALIIAGAAWRYRRHRSHRLFQYVPMEGEAAPGKKVANRFSSVSEVNERKSEKIPLLRVY